VLFNVTSQRAMSNELCAISLSESNSKRKSNTMNNDKEKRKQENVPPGIFNGEGKFDTMRGEGTNRIEMISIESLNSLGKRIIGR